MQQTLTIVDRGAALQSTMTGPRSSLAFPGAAVLPSGRWLVTCRAAPTKSASTDQSVLITASDDEGRRWSEPRVVCDAPSLHGKKGEFRDAKPLALPDGRVVMALAWVDASDPSLPLFNERTEGILDMRIFLALSEDGGETWSEPRRLDLGRYNSVPTALTGPLLVLGNGQWGLQFETNKTYYDVSPWRHASVMMFSHDEGSRWDDPVDAAADPQGRIFYWDQRPAVLTPGHALDLFWTFDRQTAAYRNIHACESRDFGRTWSAPWDTGVPGQPAPPCRLSDGRLVMVYVDRTHAPVIKARISCDGGRTWPEGTETDLYCSDLRKQEGDKTAMQDAWAEMAKYSVGLPTTTVLANGDLLVVYYAGPQTDVTGIEWIRLRAA